MTPDDLHKPLGQRPPATAGGAGPWSSRRSVLLTGLACIAAGALAAGLAYPLLPDQVRTLIAGAPNSSTPHSALPAATPPPLAASSGVSFDDVTGATPAGPRATGQAVEDASGVKVFRQGGGGAPGALIITVPHDETASLSPAPDPRLEEKGRSGPLPRVARDGARPLDVYARPFTRSARTGGPKLAIMFGGMGLDPKTTASAIAALPPAVTLGFAPYGRNLREQVARARESGHEVILQTPMEGFAPASEDPGPNVLRASAPPAENIERLHWHMSRMTGYVGIAGFMGARFTADAAALGPTLAEIGRRGLLYLDDGSSPRSLAGELAGPLGAPFVRADVILDAQPGEVDKALARLETLARERGSAIGVATGSPQLASSIARFAKGLEARGIALAPVSAIVRAADGQTARSRP